MLPVTRAYVEEGKQWFQKKTEVVLGSGHIFIASRLCQEKVSWDLKSDINFAIHKPFFLLSIKVIGCVDKHSLSAALKRQERLPKRHSRQLFAKIFFQMTHSSCGRTRCYSLVL